MKRNFIALSLSTLVILATSFASAEGSIGKQQLEGTITSLITVLTDNELSKDRQARRNKIKTILNARFSETEMAKRTLARNWKKITKEEQEEFSDTLRRLIIASYIGKIEDYGDEKVIYRNEKFLKKRYMAIETTVVGGKDNFSVNYRLKDFHGNWLIYDIHIEGVSLINNYRSQFKSFLKKKSFPELLLNLKEKLQKVEDEDLEALANNTPESRFFHNR